MNTNPLSKKPRSIKFRRDEDAYLKRRARLEGVPVALVVRWAVRAAMGNYGMTPDAQSSGGR